MNGRSPAVMIGLIAVIVLALGAIGYFAFRPKAEPKIVAPPNLKLPPPPGVKGPT